MIHTDFDGTVTLTDDNDTDRVLFLPSNSTEDEVSAAIAEFFRQPPPAAGYVRKSTVVKRLIAANKINQAVALLLTHPASFARWTAPDWPVVRVDDADAYLMLVAIDADPKTVLAAEPEAQALADRWS